MKTADDIAQQLTPEIQANNGEIGYTNRRLAKIGDGQGNAQPATLLTPRDVFYRSELDQNDRGVAILATTCPIPIQAINGYYNTEVWIGNQPGSKEVVILDFADPALRGSGGITPLEGLMNAGAKPSQDQLLIFRLAPPTDSSMSVFIDTGAIAAVAYEVGDGTMGFAGSASADISDSTNDVTFNPTDSALSSGEHRLLGIALDPTTGQYFAIPGVAQSTSETLPSANSRSEFVEADYQAIDFTGYVPCGYVYNYFGQTTPVEDDIMRQFDPRLFAKTFGSSTATGDVVGPASATNNDLAAFDGTTGKLIKDSGVLATSVVVGPASAVSNDFAMYDGATGKLIKDNGTSLSTDGTFAGNSDALIPSQKAAKTYVDNAITNAVNGLAPKADLALWTNAALAAAVYSNGSSGVGATLIGVSTGVLTVDGVAVTLGMRIGVKDQVAQLQNGPYLCTTAGAIGIAYILTRTTDADTSAELIGAYAFASQGTVNADTAFLCSNSSAITIGTTAITFVKFQGAGINQLTGDVTAGPGTGSQAAVLATVNSNVGTFTGPLAITANAKGLITAIATTTVNLATQVAGLLGLANGGTHKDLSATGPGFLKQATTGADVTVAAVDLSTADATGTLAAGRFPALTGDITTSAGSLATALATVNSNVGTFSRVKSITANAKGLITAITQGLVDLAAEVTGILPVANGGTGLATLTAHDLLVGAGTSVVAFLAPGAKGNVIASNATDYVNVAVGSNEQVVRANSNATPGIEYTGLPFSMCGRLSGSSSDPAPHSVGAASTLYWLPYNGNRVRLRDANGLYTYYTLPDAGVSVSLSGLDPFRVFDVFAFVSSGAPAIEVLGWNAPTQFAITSITNASPPQISTAIEPTVGDTIRIIGVGGTGAVNGTWRAGTNVPVTRFTLLNLDGTNPAAPGSTTGGGTWQAIYQPTTRATAIDFLGGVYEKHGDSTRLYLGTFFTFATGQFPDTVTSRYLWNYFNRIPRVLRVNDSTASWTMAASATWEPDNNSTGNRVSFVIGVDDMPVSIRKHVTANARATNGSALSGISLDSINTPTFFNGVVATSVNITAPIDAGYSDYPGVGIHYAQGMEDAVTVIAGFTGNGQHLIEGEVMG